MASAKPEPTPNPNAMKFNLDVALPETFNVADAGDAPNAFARQIMATAGVASIFGTASFVTVTRRDGRYEVASDPFDGRVRWTVRQMTQTGQ